MQASGQSVLVVEDDPIVTSSVSWLLAERGYRFECVTTVALAAERLAAAHWNALLVDMYLPDGEGLAVLERALALVPPPLVIMMTGRAELRSAVESMRRGAADFLEKPLDLEDLGARLARALGAATMQRKLAEYEARERQQVLPVAHSAALAEVLAVADRVAATPASSAMLLGESGVGKEVIASRIHDASDRRGGPFVRVNLAAIPASMIEAELFGSVRGAFTDAKRDRAGHFASAEGGTLLLDELGEFKLELQPKLLRVLEERRFYPVGSDRERRTNVRVLAATNRDPRRMIAEGLLREDLYYRLATVVIRVPPLRDRVTDILPLAEHFLNLYRAEFKRPAARLSAAAQSALERYPWPGNVRELRNAIERAVMLSPGDEIGVAPLGLAEGADRASPEPASPHGSVSSMQPASPASGSNGEAAGAAAPPESLRLDEVEKVHIARVLGMAEGSRTRAAALLGISRTTLWDKGKRYGMW